MVIADSSTIESRTRDRVLRVVSQEGPVSIPSLVDRLGLTETAVRRHVENLAAEGLVEVSWEEGLPERADACRRSGPGTLAETTDPKRTPYA